MQSSNFYTALDKIIKDFMVEEGGLGILVNHDVLSSDYPMTLEEMNDVEIDTMLSSSIQARFLIFYTKSFDQSILVTCFSLPLEWLESY